MEWGRREPSTEQCSGHGNGVGHLGERERYVAVPSGWKTLECPQAGDGNHLSNYYEHFKIAILGPSNSTSWKFLLVRIIALKCTYEDVHSVIIYNC